jgi:arylsulfatase A-like enzyme
VLKGAGYRTGAFVGAFVLDARFGLNHGFDLYDDRMRGTGTSLEVVQRTAEEVLEPAARWITAPSTPAPGTTAPSTSAPSTPAPGARAPSTSAPSTSAPITQHPFFAWVHLYDPHEPYAPPEPYRSRYAADAYAGEIAYADAALGAFLDRLRAAGALDRTLVVVTADHGESLGEHGERTHGLFAYDATIRVPLVLWTATATTPAVVASPARLVDVMPTILDLVGVPPPAALDGRSIRPFATGEREDDHAPSYFEALNANLTRGWAPLHGIVAGQLKLIDLPVTELYDLAADPSETQNIYAAQRQRARSLEGQLDRLRAAAAAPTPAAMDPDAQARLRSLGYTASSAVRPARTYTAGDDPKRLVHLNQALDTASAMREKGDAAGAVETLRGVIRERPDLTIAYDRLALLLRDSGRIGEAVTLLDDAARAGHADAALMRSLGAMLRDAGQLPRSAAVLDVLVRQNAADLESLDALGQTYTRMKRPRDAEAMFTRVLAASPNAATTWSNLGVLYLTEDRNADAIDALTRAVTIDPALAGAHNGLGVAYARQNDVTRAVGEWREALRLRPDLADARANLRRVEGK